ncbi:MAG: hypothetical protein ACREHE_11160 [Rhizomicrobium sp.]
MQRAVSRGAVVAFVLISAVHAASRAAIYVNARYGYSISYPAELLTPQPEAENGDGRAFKAKVGKAEFLVFAESNALNETPEALAGEAEADCPTHHADYRIAKSTLVAVSCVTSTDILYRKTPIRDDILTTISARYPKSERTRWDSVVVEMADSLTLAQANNLNTQRSSMSPAVDKNFTKCLLSKAKDGQYASFDGGISAMQPLGRCPIQWNAYVDACVSSGDTEGNCNLKGGLLAQAALKLLNK